MRTFFHWLACCVFLTGCTTDNAYRYYGTARYPAKQANTVEVLRESPTRTHEVIADFQCRGGSAKKMQNLAAKIGADAVIVTFVGGYYNRNDVWAGNDSMTNSAFRTLGTAIKYKDTP